MKQFIYLIIAIGVYNLFINFISYPVQAFSGEAGSTAQLVTTTPAIDPRVIKLRGYLDYYNAPVAEYAKDFIKEADTYNLDWKLVAAISGLESTYCKFIPSYSYNCWGWGIPTGASDGIHFKNFSDGIHVVSQGLRQHYQDQGAITIEQIGRIYAASPTWAQRVRMIMGNIEDFIPKTNEYTLAFDL